MSLIVCNLSELPDGAPIWTTLGGETKISGIVIRSPDEERAAIFVLKSNRTLTPTPNVSPPLIWDHGNDISVVSRTEDSYIPIFDEELFVEDVDIVEAIHAPPRQPNQMYLSKNGLGLYAVKPTNKGIETKPVKLPYAVNSPGSVRPSEGLIAISKSWRIGYRNLSNPAAPSDVWMFDNREPD